MWPYLIAIGVLGAAGSLILGGALRGGDETPPPPTPTRHPSGARMRDPITTWAEQNRVHPSIPLAIRTVEAGRLPAVDPAGRPLIRFEAHVFIAQLRKAGVSEATIAATARRHFSFDKSEGWKNQRIAPRGAGDWRALHTGSQVDEHAAPRISGPSPKDPAPPARRPTAPRGGPPAAPW